MWVGGLRHAPAALPPGKIRYPLYRRLGGPQGRSGQVWVSTRNISWWVQAVGELGCQPYHLHVSIVQKSGSLNLMKLYGPVRGLNPERNHIR